MYLQAHKLTTPHPPLNTHTSQMSTIAGPNFIFGSKVQAITTYRIHEIHAETIAEFWDSEGDFVKMNFLVAPIYSTTYTHHVKAQTASVSDISSTATIKVTAIARFFA